MRRLVEDLMGSFTILVYRNLKRMETPAPGGQVDMTERDSGSREAWFAVFERNVRAK
jgi:hypothetical protein